MKSTHRFLDLLRSSPKTVYYRLSECTHTPDNVLISSLVGPTLVTGCRQRDHLLFPDQLQLLIEGLGILLLRRQQQLAESHPPGAGLTVYKSIGDAIPLNYIRLMCHQRFKIQFTYNGSLCFNDLNSSNPPAGPTARASRRPPLGKCSAPTSSRP